jgi:hypothetical protein
VEVLQGHGTVVFLAEVADLDHGSLRASGLSPGGVQVL